jgi:hypothetical protein
MKNVTVTLDDEVARWARIWAARHNTSVLKLLGDVKKPLNSTKAFSRPGGFSPFAMAVGADTLACAKVIEHP